MPATIHPLSLAYLEARDAYTNAYADFDAAIRGRFGSNVTRWDLKDFRAWALDPDLWAAHKKEERARIAHSDALAAMRAAGVTVHPIAEA